MNNEDLKQQRSKRFQCVVEEIQNWIAQGKYKQGERLPAERKLAAYFEVSRNSVREAFLLLEQKNIIDIRRGVKGGAYVIAPILSKVEDELSQSLNSNGMTLETIAQFREAIETSIASIAAQKADAGDIRHLHFLVEEIRPYLGRGSGWVDEFIEADKAVHLSIAHISDNSLLQQALRTTLSQECYFTRFLKLQPSLMEENYKDLGAIVRAIENHQPDEAGFLSHTHIVRFNKAAA